MSEPPPRRLGEAEAGEAFARAARHFEAGELEPAAELCRALQASFPRHPGVLGLYGLVQLKRGRREEGLDKLARAAQLAPGDAELQANLGAALLEAGKSAPAAAAYRRAAALRPGEPRFAFGLARALVAAGEAEPAVAAVEPVASTDIAAAIAIADGLRGLARPDLARRLLDPLTDVFGDDEALRRAAGQACYERGDAEEAAAHWSAALSRRPDDEVLAFALGLAQIQCGRTDAGIAALTRSLALAPRVRTRIALATALPAVPASRAEIGAARARFLAETIALASTATAVPGPPPVGCGTALLAYHDEDSRPHRAAYAALMRAVVPRASFVARHCDGYRGPATARPRIGVFSAHLFDHTIADLFAGIVDRLDRDRFETWVFFGPGARDEVRGRVRAAAERPVDLPADVFRAQEVIASAALDALLFLDIGLRPDWDLLAHGRLAPVQAALWGHPETTGIPTIDWFISCAAMEPADGATHYDERLIGLPGSGTTVSSTLRDAVDGARGTADRARFGLRDGTLYVCPQSLFKLHPDFDAALAAILRADPAGRLVLLRMPAASMAEAFRKRFAAAAPDVVGRVDVVSPVRKTAFPALLAACDVMLDPFHYSGGHTTLTAFCAGLPVVTWPGRFMRGRHTYGFCRLTGLDELVATDPHDYVRRAVALGRDRSARAAVAGRLRAARDVLFDGPMVTRALGGILEDAIAAAAAGRGRTV